jgi:hypothetical protein
MGLAVSAQVVCTSHVVPLYRHCPAPLCVTAFPVCVMGRLSKQLSFGSSLASIDASTSQARLLVMSWAPVPPSDGAVSTTCRVFLQLFALLFALNKSPAPSLVRGETSKCLVAFSSVLLTRLSIMARRGVRTAMCALRR